jgi:hypothetical protein
MIIADDFNISFGDNYYFTKEGRDKLNSAFSDLSLLNLTVKFVNNIDQIDVSDGFVGKQVLVNCWNFDKSLIARFGMCLT